MIRPPGFRGVAFTAARHGDLRNDSAARRGVSGHLEVPDAWATVDQIHGGVVVEAHAAGSLGEADALFTSRSLTPLAVFTADCLAVAVEADGGVGIAHAGWRGIVAGVVENLLTAMEAVGLNPLRAAIGPGIGPCCFEVGPEVAARFPAGLATTTWGTASVDLPGAVAARLEGLEVWQAEACTRCSNAYFSHRRDRTASRMAGIGWLS